LLPSGAKLYNGLVARLHSMLNDVQQRCVSFFFPDREEPARGQRVSCRCGPSIVYCGNKGHDMLTLSFN
jgi:hypothetical protein